MRSYLKKKKKIVLLKGPMNKTFVNILLKIFPMKWMRNFNKKVAISTLIVASTILIQKFELVLTDFLFIF